MIAAGTPDATLMSLVRAIVTNDSGAAWRLLAATPTLAHAQFAQGATRQAAKAYYLHEIEHYLYAGDTALHMAAAARSLSTTPSTACPTREGGTRARKPRPLPTLSKWALIQTPPTPAA